MFSKNKMIPVSRISARLALAFCLFASLIATAARAADQKLPGHPAYKWQQTTTSVTLFNRGHIVWQFHYGPDASKPYFHPLALTDGAVLTCLSPHDHPWHHALWFSWKMLNGVNYWEEDRKTGLSDGRTEVLSAKVALHHDHSATLRLTLSYHPVNGPAVLTEERTIEVSRPGADGRYHIDWQGTFTAGQQDVVLQGGTAGGGYAGLSVRISQATHDWRLIDSEGREDSPGGTTAKNTHGRKASWADFSVVDNASGAVGGIAIFQHPSSFRYPSYWHNIINDHLLFGYFSPAPLWAEPFTLGAGKTLDVRYRILVHPGRESKEQLAAEMAGSAAL
jgi:hypothetical protein